MSKRLKRDNMPTSPPSYDQIKARNRKLFRNGFRGTRRMYPPVEKIDLEKMDVEEALEEFPTPALPIVSTSALARNSRLILTQNLCDLPMPELLVQLKMDQDRLLNNRVNEAAVVTPEAAQRQLDENLAELAVKKPLLEEVLAQRKSLDELADYLAPQVNYLESEAIAADALGIKPSVVPVQPPPSISVVALRLDNSNALYKRIS